MSIFEHIDKKMVIGFGILFLLLAGGFFYWLAGSENGEGSGPITVLPTSPLDATLGRDLLAALATLKSTKLDTSVFSDPVFLSLKDFGVEISAQPVGRRNPFALFGDVTDEKATAVKGVSGQPKSPTIPKQNPVPPKTPATTPKTPVPEPGGFDIN